MKRKFLLILSLALFALAAISGLYFLSFRAKHPDKILKGSNVYSLGNYDLSKEGLEGFKEIISKSENMPASYAVAYFEAAIDKNCKLSSFTLSLYSYDESGEYCGIAGYTYLIGELTYSPPAPDNLPLVREYNENSALEYLSRELQKLPLKKQLKESGLEHYFIRYQPYTLIEAGTPIFDGRSGNPFPVLTKDAYNSGNGGTSDGNTNVVFRLYDGQSIAGGQQYLYVCKPANPETAIGDRSSTMEADYLINGGKLKFTRNHGQSWIEADITESELTSTLEFYRGALSLPPQSLFISPDEGLPIAYFYGENPVLKISHDNGTSWSSAAFPSGDDFGREITKRAVGFLSDSFGYAALGTDWSMGAGENKMCYFTFDGGKTWTERPLPLQGESRTLNDIEMADTNTGALSLDGGSDVYFPLLFVTEDTGESWAEIKLPFEQLPQEIQYLTDIESFSLSGGIYSLTLGQGDLGTLKAEFTASELDGEWSFSGFMNKAIHIVG